MHRMKNNYAKLSKGQRLLADYIMAHYDKAVFQTAAKLGNTVGVSESTVVRFAYELGYDGYPKLQRALESLVKSKLTSIQRAEATLAKLNQENLVQSVLTADKENVKHTLEELNPTDFNQAVECLIKADTIYIIGVRSSAALAEFAGFYFKLMFDNIRIINTNSVSEIFEQIHRISPADVMICFSFPRYSKRTIKAAEYARLKQAQTICITDTKMSPITNHASISLFARSNMISIVDSLVAPLSLVNALIAELSVRKMKTLSERLVELEEIWTKYQVYEDDNLDSSYKL